MRLSAVDRKILALIQEEIPLVARPFKVMADKIGIEEKELLEKIAEDRINPAKISAGAAAPFSGEVMPKGQAVFGGATTPAQLVSMKAQKVRNRINSDMKQYVKNVGDGYNLQGHLTKFNK